MKPDNSLAVIGGGASATLLLAHFSMQQNTRPREIKIFDRTGRFGTGIAYSASEPAHLLNVRASGMSAFQDDPVHFARWAAGRGFEAGDFVPRMIYGIYLREVLDEAVARLQAQGHQVHFVQEEVLESRKDSRRYVLKTNQNIHDAACVVLASGNAVPIMPRGEGFYKEPWNLPDGAFIKAQHIILCGTGLSAVDAVLSLKAGGFKGTITAISRRGLLPAIHTAPEEYKDLPKVLPCGVLPLLRMVREHAARADAQGQSWQGVIDALRPSVNEIWQALSAADRRVFLKRLLPYWNIHRHRMAPEVGAVISGMLQDKTLRIVKGDIEKVVAGKDVHCGGQILKADAVINCLGYGYAPAGRTMETEYRLGPACFGDLFETTALREIREQAAALARSLAN